MSEAPVLQYRWRKTWPDIDDNDSWETDFMGWDGDVPVGRIRLETANLKKGQWQWSAHGPMKLPKGRLLPHQGFEPSARQAAAMVEDYYDRLLKHNGLRE